MSHTCIRVHRVRSTGIYLLPIGENCAEADHTDDNGRAARVDRPVYARTLDATGTATLVGQRDHARGLLLATAQPGDVFRETFTLDSACRECGWSTRIGVARIVCGVCDGRDSPPDPSAPACSVLASATPGESIAAGVVAGGVIALAIRPRRSDR